MERVHGCGLLLGCSQKATRGTGGLGASNPYNPDNPPERAVEAIST